MPGAPSRQKKTKQSREGKPIQDRVQNAGKAQRETEWTPEGKRVRREQRVGARELYEDWKKKCTYVYVQEGEFPLSETLWPLANFEIKGTEKRGIEGGEC